jgi:hypothetical protein
MFKLSRNLRTSVHIDHIWVYLLIYLMYENLRKVEMYVT